MAPRAGSFLTTPGRAAKRGMLERSRLRPQTCIPFMEDLTLIRLGPTRRHIVLHLHTRKTAMNPLSRIKTALVVLPLSASCRAQRVPAADTRDFGFQSPVFLFQFVPDGVHEALCLLNLSRSSKPDRCVGEVQSSPGIPPAGAGGSFNSNLETAAMTSPGIPAEADR